MVAERRGVELPEVHDVDRRDVLQQRRGRRGGTDVVAAGQQQRPAGQRRGLLVEQRAQCGGAAGRDGAAVDGRRARLELTVEVVQTHDRDRRVAPRVLDDVAPHDALALLRGRDAEQERGRRREVDRAHVARGAVLDPRAAGQERRAHVGVGLQVLHVRHVAVLAEERRARDQRAGRRRVVLVRRVGEDHQVARAGRVRHVGGRAGPVGDVARLGLGEGAVDDLPVLGLAVAGPVVGVLQREEGGLDPGDLLRLGALAGRADLRSGARRRRVAAGQVQVDLRGAAGVADLGLGDRLGARGRLRRGVLRAAVAGLRMRQQAEVDEHLGGVDGQELRREAVIGGHEGRQVAVAHALLGEPHRLVGALVGLPDEALALLDAAVLGAVDGDVVVGRVVGAVRELAWSRGRGTGAGPRR